jgi:hypothetical protein
MGLTPTYSPDPASGRYLARFDCGRQPSIRCQIVRAARFLADGASAAHLTSPNRAGLDSLQVFQSKRPRGCLLELPPKQRGREVFEQSYRYAKAKAADAVSSAA